MAAKLTIYFTSDTHGYLYPTNFADNAPRPMGLLGMRFPKDGNTLVIDGGDTLQGSPLTYYCHTQGVPQPAARAMNERGYDYVTLGNHDFNYGQETLLAHLSELTARCLCANVADARGRLPVEGYAVRTLANGLRVGLVGVTTSWINLWERPENLTGLTIGDPFAAAKAAVEALKGKTDVLVGLYHGGCEKDLDTGRRLSDTDENIACRLCEELPFDLLLTGHQHIAMANHTYHGTHIVQPPANATAYVRVLMDEEKHFTSELLSPPAEAALRPWEQGLLDDLNRWLDRPIGRLSRAVRPEARLAMALHGSPVADFINQAQLAASGAQLSCTALGNEVRGFGRVMTVRDVTASYTYSNTLVVLEVTGGVLRQALEQCATYFAMDEAGKVAIAEPFLRPKEAHYNYDYFSGIEYAFDLRRPAGSRVTTLTRDGRPVEDGETLTLAMNNYRATGAGGFDFYTRCKRVKEIQTEVSELILDYLREWETVEIPEREPYTAILPDGSVA